MRTIVNIMPGLGKQETSGFIFFVEYSPYLTQKTFRFFLFVFALTGLCLPGHTQPSEPPSGYAHVTFDVTDGLPSSLVTCVYQDRHGFLWIGTDVGLSLYDGLVFQNFSLSDGLAGNFVNCITENPSDGSIWVGTNLGISRLTTRGIDKFGKKAGIAENDVKSLFIDSLGTAWAVTRNYIIHLDGTSIENFPVSQISTGLEAYRIFAVQDRMLVGTSNGILEMKNGKFHWFWESEDRAFVVSMAMDARGRLWFTRHTGELFVMDHGHVEELNVPGNDDFVLGALVPSRDGRMFIAHSDAITTWQNGQFQNQPIHVIDKSLGSVITFIEDREQNLWVATSLGLHRYSPSHATPVRHCVENLLSKGFTSVVSFSEDSVLTGGHYGAVYRVKNGCASAVMADKPLQYGSVAGMLKAPDKSVWIGTSFGGLVQAGQAGYEVFSAENKRLTSNRIFCGITTRDQKLVFGTYQAVVVIDKAGIKTMSSPLLKEQNVLTLFEDQQGRVWIGTQKGPYVFEADTFRDMSPSLGVEDVYISSITQHPSGAMFFGTKGMGVLHTSAGGGAPSWINRKHGLYNEAVLEMAFDAGEILWAITKAGLYQVSNAEKTNVKAIPMGEAEGISETSWNDPDLDIDPAGNLWITSGQQLWKIDLQKHQGLRAPPQPYITGVDVLPYGSQRRIMDWVMESGDTVASFAYDANNIRFSFSAPAFGGSARVGYRYRMVGYDTQWVEAIDQRSVSYSNLAPGEYTFEVCSVLGNARGDKCASFVFSIDTPFWKTWWFITGLAVLVLALGVMTIRFRVARVLAKAQEKNEINRQIAESRLMAFRAQTNPHFIFNALSSVQHFITKGDRTSALTYLSKFSRLLRSTLDQSRNTRVSLAEELQLLRTYIEIEQLRFEQEMDFQVHVDPDIDQEHTYLPAMIIQPFVENAIIHGLLPKESYGVLKMFIQRKGAMVQVEIEDNGIGREAARQLQAQRKSHQAHGMKIALERINLLKDSGEAQPSVTIEDLHDNEGKALGTRVVITLPYEN